MPEGVKVNIFKKTQALNAYYKNTRFLKLQNRKYSQKNYIERYMNGIKPQPIIEK